MAPSRQAVLGIPSSLLLVLSVAAWPALSTLRADFPQTPHQPAAAGSSASADPALWFAQGQAALQRGDLTTAESAFRRVASLDPQSGSAYANLGVIAMRRKQWDHALTLLQ